MAHNLRKAYKVIRFVMTQGSERSDAFNSSLLYPSSVVANTVFYCVKDVVEYGQGQKSEMQHDASHFELANEIPVHKDSKTWQDRHEWSDKVFTLLGSWTRRVPCPKSLYSWTPPNKNDHANNHGQEEKHRNCFSRLGKSKMRQHNSSQ